MEQLSTAKVLEAQFGLDLKGLLRLSPNLYKSCSLLRASGTVFRSGRVVQYCRLESSRILFFPSENRKFSGVKSYQVYWIHWTRIDSDGKVNFLFVRDLE